MEDQPNKQFRYMQVVKQSQKARDSFIHNPGYAIVLGWSRDGRCIIVRRLGKRGRTGYHYSFWDKCTPEEEQEAATINSNFMLGIITQLS